ncbi:hypothetical protein PQX77_021345 [Marasmius sp. AFHP31]|nr:hypothetical protein PQX77_021345 [Marasmius sp. AFHP31]
MEEYPEEYGFVNFKINIDPTASYLAEAEQLWAPTDHEVFKLVPDEFHVIIEGVYSALGQPPVNQDNVWQVYMTVLEQIEELVGDNIVGLPIMGYNQDDEDYSVSQDDQGMLAQLEEEMAKLVLLRDDAGEAYMGGVNGGLGAEGDVWDEQVLDAYVNFTSDEEDNAYDAVVSSDKLDASQVQQHLLQ